MKDEAEPIITIDPRVVPRAGEPESFKRGSWVFMSADTFFVTKKDPVTLVSRSRTNS